MTHGQQDSPTERYFLPLWGFSCAVRYSSHTKGKNAATGLKSGKFAVFGVSVCLQHNRKQQKTHVRRLALPASYGLAIVANVATDKQRAA